VYPVRDRSLGFEDRLRLSRATVRTAAMDWEGSGTMSFKFSEFPGIDSKHVTKLRAVAI